jgi:hypothetical protein
MMRRSVFQRSANFIRFFNGVPVGCALEEKGGTLRASHRTAAERIFQGSANP